MPSSIPPAFAQNTIDLFGEQGREWLANLPRLLATLEERWNLRLLPPFELSYNYVAPAERADGSQVVLKVWLVNPEMVSEMESLRLWDGRGIVRLLESDLEQGAMLLERLRPGVPLAETEDDEQATRVAAQVMSELWIPAPPDPRGLLRTAAGWERGYARLRQTFGGGTGPFPTRLIKMAERHSADLLASAGPLRLLHGDLHHWNILSAERRPWLALDPKGVVGEAAYEIGPWLLNKFPENDGQAALARFCSRRLDMFQEILGLERRRMLAWSFTRSVLSAWWSYEDHQRVEAGALFLAETLAGMMEKQI